MATNLNASQLDSSSSLSIGQTDLLIVGPGVLGRLVAHQWRQVLLINYSVDLIFHCFDFR